MITLLWLLVPLAPLIAIGILGIGYLIYGLLYALVYVTEKVEERCSR